MKEIQSEEKMLFRTSIKKSKKREIWQIKDQDHAIYSLDGLHEIIESVINYLGFNLLDRTKIYELVFGTKEYPNFQFKLEKDKIGSDYIDFKISENRIGDSKLTVWLPKILFSSFNDYPEILYISIRESERQNIVFIEKI